MKNNKKYFLVTLCFLVFFISGQAKVDSVSVCEMKQMFYDHYQNHVISDSLLDKHMILNRGYITGKMYEDFDNYVVPNKLLTNAGKIELPPSNFVIYQQNGSDDYTYFYWAGFRNSEQVQNAAKLKSDLFKHFGRFDINNTLTVVHATWIPGRIYVLTDPFQYGTTYVSYHMRSIRFEDGCVMQLRDSDSIVLGSSSLEKEAEYLVDGTYFMARQEEFMTREERQRDDEWHSYRALCLFGRDVTRLCTPQSNSNTQYSLLFYFDAHRKVHVEVLLPQRLNDVDKEQISQLTNAVALQPPKLFGSSFTIDGRVFPGIYVKAAYKKNGWIFRDYRFEKEF